MQELLLGYLFDQLTAEEKQQVERALTADPQLRQALEQLRVCITPEKTSEESASLASSIPVGASEAFSHSSETVSEETLPSDLAKRTCKNIAVTSWSAGSLCLADKPTGERSWHFADVAVTLGIALTVMMMLFPALQQSRFLSRRNACQNNLRYLGETMLAYAEKNNGSIPAVPAEGNDSASGVFSVALLDSGLIEREELLKRLVCPSSMLANQLRQGLVVIQVPHRRELLAAKGQALQRLRQVMGGSFAYRVGYIHAGQYRNVRISGSGYNPILADVPSEHLIDLQSNSHDGTGQNVLFDDGHVRFVVTCTLCDRNDAFFVNRIGIQAAGLDADDAVLLPSSEGPRLEMLRQRLPVTVPVSFYPEQFGQ